MIDGINLLNSIPLTGPNALMVGIAITAFILSIVGIIYTIVEDLAAGFFVCIIMFFVSLFAIPIAADQPNGKYKYEVSFSDNVNLKELNKKYEILGQRGEIYIIQERK